jgi:hypothetical protein
VKLCLEVGIVLDLDYTGLWVVETGLGELDLLGRTYFYVGYLTVSLDWHTQHIVTHSFNVDCHHSFVLLYRLRVELYLDQSL